ncbi:ribonucleoprotein PTB-binding 1-like isoform X2 [Lycorma delicatula]|uniref:ribonucleoprotein PTB-binding 1-like isoform X2 n=1 Tax=Lycorma delicatula TaxID=130591 RepID=UPI003F513205
MAAGSTETAFTSANPALGCFNANLLKNDSNKYWNGAHIMAIASTDSFWEDDPEEKIKKKVLDSKSKFHMGRQLQIKHLPRDVTEDEIREMLCDFPVQSVQVMHSGTGSSMARAVLEDPEMLEDWDRNRVFHLRGQCVPVTPTHTEMMLCVARLPLQYTEEQFTALIRSYGEIKRHFLMISEKTGESKGYGFVEYTTKECALQAKNMLDKKQVDGWTLVCDWLDSSHVTFESLHSKCLYVDQLPKDFRDMSEFRKIFSPIINPPYCQIALKNGCPQDWGLVEFSNWEDAEAAQMTLNGYNLRGQQIRISYYIPGVHAINLYLKLLNDPGPKVKTGGLLPDPSGQVIIQSLQNLFKQNPIFAQNLQNIILGQIQASQNGEVLDGQKKPPGGQVPINGTSIPKGGIGEPGVCKGFRSGEGHKGPGPGGKNGLQPSVSPHATPPNPNSFLKPPPPPAQKLPLLSTPTAGRRVSLSPPSGEVTPVPEENYWPNLLGQLRTAPPQPHPHNGYPTSLPPPPPPPPPPTMRVSAEPPTRTFSMPPPNYITADGTVDVQQSILNLLSNPQNLQQFLTSLHSLGQSTTAAPPTFTYPLSTIQPGVEGWGTPPHHLPRSLLTSPIPMAVPPKPPIFPAATAWASPTFLPSPPPPPHQPIFSPFESPGLIWSQAATQLIAYPQPNPIMTPIGQKRRLLPSPEPSPEGNYIGQHSQGIGGHYADSFFKRKKKH